MLELYVMETCPYCKKVMDYMEQNKIEYKKNDIGEPEHHSELMKLGGKYQVPFLYDKECELKMYESSDIIEHLKEHKK